MPQALKGVRPQVVISEGGAAGGVVSEGMGYGIMIEGLEAVRGSRDALERGLALVKSWLGMVYGPANFEGWVHPLGGGLPGNALSAADVLTWPYGVSSIREATGPGIAGLPSWKFPLDQCEGNCNGTATDGDQDALLGMIYLAAALGYPDDFVDMVMRTVITFASADLGFPDIYRTLPGGERIFVPKMGSSWGGLTPDSGAYKTQQAPWCYSPGYFGPAHYRTFRDFARSRWRPHFANYLPKHVNSQPSTLEELLVAFDGAVTSGYNILYYSSCNSGAVSNWVGVGAACGVNDTGSGLNCEGIPWKYTPYVGTEKETCNSSGTAFGQFGADASRAPWRIAMDHVLYRNESRLVTMYDRDGKVDESITFGSQEYLNRIVGQYVRHSKCNGGKAGDCLTPDSNPPYSPWKLATAWDSHRRDPVPDLTCDGVPAGPDSWWGGYLAYPTFSAFVAPFSQITPEESLCWMDTFSCICNVKSDTPTGPICQTTYFDVSQAVISTMIMATSLTKLEDAQQVGSTDAVAIMRNQALRDGNPQVPVVSVNDTVPRALFLPSGVLAGLAVLSALGLIVRLVCVHRNWSPAMDNTADSKRVLHRYESVHEQHLMSVTNGSFEVQQQEQGHTSMGLDRL